MNQKNSQNDNRGKSFSASSMDRSSSKSQPTGSSNFGRNEMNAEEEKKKLRQEEIFFRMTEGNWPRRKY